MTSSVKKLTAQPPKGSVGYKNQVVLQMTFKPAYLILFLCILYIIIGYLSEDYLLAGGGAIGLFILKFW